MRNLINERVYVGQSDDIWGRYLTHRAELSKPHKGNKEMKKDYQLQGGDAFVLQILEECWPEELNQKELYWMDVLKSDQKTFGYNVHPGPHPGKRC